MVAAVAVLSATLREDATYRELGLFLVSYGAVWFAWVSVVMYADVAGEQTASARSSCRCSCWR